MKSESSLESGSTKGTLILSVLKKKNGFLLIYSANPAQGATSSPLRDSALTYTQYRPKRMVFKYTPSVAATATGSLVFCALRTEDAEFDFDTTADQGKLFLAMASSAGAVSWRVSEPKTWRVPVGTFPTDWFYMDLEKGNAVPFMVYCALDDSSDIADGATLGRIALEYAYEFQGKRKTPANAVSMDDSYGVVTISGVPSSYRDGLFNLHLKDKVGGVLRDGMKIISKAVAKAGETALTTGLAAGKQALLSRLGYASRTAYGYSEEDPEVFELIVDGGAITAETEGTVSGDFIVPYVGSGVTGDALSLNAEVNELDERVATLESAIEERCVRIAYPQFTLSPTYSAVVPATLSSEAGDVEVDEVFIRRGVGTETLRTDTVGDIGVTWVAGEAYLSFGAGGTFACAHLYRLATSSASQWICDCGPKSCTFYVAGDKSLHLANDDSTASSVYYYAHTSIAGHID
jgi:hypothetical protein